MSPSFPPISGQRIAYKCWQILKFPVMAYFLGIPTYAIICRYTLPPLTWAQLESWLQHPKTFRRNHVAFEDISPHMVLAVIEAEDGKFLSHNGFDWDAIKATWSKGKGGASTITNQSAKNVFLTLHSNWLRKALEIYPTWVIDKVWSKRRTLEVCLNSIEFGEGVWGIEAASRKYFDRPASKLTRKQAAWLAACLPDPKGCISDRRHTSADLARRHQQILHGMAYLEQSKAVRQFLKPDSDQP
jgi:monofunctional glycosyltransferase